MESRSDPPRRARDCCPENGDGEEDGVDRISSLPDDLLLQVLIRLRCARAAAHTSLVSRRWRDLWRYLPELTFREVLPDALRAALARVTRTELSLLDIDVPERHRFSPAGVASLLRTAARLTPVELQLIVWGLCQEDRPVAVEVPCFRRATSIELGVWNLRIALPEEKGAVFPVLERLSDGCSFDFGRWISRCPRLRQLEACHNGGLGTVMVHSQTIEGLRVHGVGLRSIDVVAPMLKKFTLNTHSACDLSVTFSALMLENVNWYYGLFPCFVGIGDKWGLRSVGLQLEERVYLLWLKIEALDYRPSRGGNMMPKIAKLPNFSILKIPLVTWVHVSGGVVLNTLEICNSIKRLKLILHLKSGKPCLLNCPCDQPNNWRNQFIT